MPQHGNIEVDQKADRQLSQLEIGDHLGLMNVQQTFDALEFDQHLPFDDVVDPEGTIEQIAFVPNWQGDLSDEVKAGRS